jgi:uncharacterized protein
VNDGRAACLRNIVWDSIENKLSQQSRDVDLVYFNSADVVPEADWEYDDKMKREYPIVEWEIKNQARMHDVNCFSPFTAQPSARSSDSQRRRNEQAESRQ